MRRAIRKRAREFTAILFIFLGALGIAGYILSNQRFYLPAWVPLVGTDFYDVNVELPTAQAIVPGQGQTVDIAGVQVGDVGKVTLESGHAVVQMRIKTKYKPIYRDATVLLRPKTGLKDMYLSLDPGTKQAGALPEGGRVPLENTLPDVNTDEVLAQLDSDTRAYLRVLLGAGGEAFSDQKDRETGQTASQDLRETLKRFEPSARAGREITRGLMARRHNIKRVIHNFQLLSTELGRKDRQLAAFVDSANANFAAFAQEEAPLREALRRFPGALSQTETTLRKTSTLAAELRPTLQGLRPFARDLAPSLRKTRPFLRETTPIIRDQIRPFARDVQPTVRDLRPTARDLAVVSPRLTNTFKVLNKLYNELAYDPPGPADSFLFWSAWGAHNGASLFAAQDAHGPFRRGIVLVPCTTYGTLNAIVPANPQLGMSTRLLNLPAERDVCPGHELIDTEPP